MGPACLTINRAEEEAVEVLGEDDERRSHPERNALGEGDGVAAAVREPIVHIQEV